MGIFMWILVGLVAGWLTGKIMKGSGYGFIVDILLGIAGALIGGFIASHLGLDAHGGFIYSTLDRPWRRDYPGGDPPAAQAGLTAPAPLAAWRRCSAVAVCGRGERTRALDLILSRQLSGGVPEAVAVAGAAAGAGRFTHQDGKARKSEAARRIVNHV